MMIAGFNFSDLYSRQRDSSRCYQHGGGPYVTRVIDKLHEPQRPHSSQFGITTKSMSNTRLLEVKDL
jgi:hypothetical protein